MNQWLEIEDELAHLLDVWLMVGFLLWSYVTHRPRFGHWFLPTFDPPYSNPAEMIEELFGARHTGGELVDGSDPVDHIAAQWAYHNPPWWDEPYKRAKPGTYKDPREPWNQRGVI